jgi:hypothetical protein
MGLATLFYAFSSTLIACVLATRAMRTDSFIYISKIIL